MLLIIESEHVVMPVTNFYIILQPCLGAVFYFKVDSLCELVN